MRTSLILAVLLSLVHPGSARAQSQITTGVIDGIATDATGAALPGVTIEARNVDTNFTRTAMTGGRRPLRALAAAAGPLQGNVHAFRFRDARPRRTSSSPSVRRSRWRLR